MKKQHHKYFQSGSKKSRKFGQKSKRNHLRKVDGLIYLKKYKHSNFFILLLLLK
uniref:50S ribosomal protein L32 n=1 Tax=Heterorhabditis bacteriophora TaxID=37862 RepID=A0A1I7WWC3_HETBA